MNGKGHEASTAAVVNINTKPVQTAVNQIRVFLGLSFEPYHVKAAMEIVPAGIAQPGAFTELPRIAIKRKITAIKRKFLTVLIVSLFIREEILIDRILF